MSSLYITHSAALAHDMGLGHPEQPDRLRVINYALQQEKFRHLWREEAPIAEQNAILLVHPEAYLERFRAISPKEGIVAIDSDTIMNKHSLEAALRAAGGATLAIDRVLSGQYTNAFVGMRPPGHHAERLTPMGFCFFNSIAIAAQHARHKHAVERIAIVDFDVHHGNGTQDIFYNDPNVLFASTHQMPLYPGTGALCECGQYNQIVNVPLRAGDDGSVFREAVSSRILPRIEAFSPDLILISAGFDAHERDPLGSLRFGEEDYAWITDQLMHLSARFCQNRLVSLLEGGYDLQALEASVSAHVAVLMGSSLS